MTSETEKFYNFGPSHLTYVNWDDAYHRKSVASSLVNGVYVLENDRQKQRKGPDSLACHWWEFFHFQLLDRLYDIDDGSIFGAIYEFKPVSSMCNDTLHRSPRYVIAFRGTTIKPVSVLCDMKLDLKIFLRKFHDQTSRLKIAIEIVRKRVAGGNGSNIWLAGHSLGSCIALHAGKIMAKSGIFIESFLFNPPFPSAPLDQIIKSKKVKKVIRFAGSGIRAGLGIAMNSDKKASFAALSDWIPSLFVNPSDYICSEYVGYFEHRKKMEQIGAGCIESIATQNSIGSIMVSVLGKECEPVHLLPSAILTVNLTPQHDCIEAHGIQQWWKPDLHLESKLHKYKYVGVGVV